MLKLKRISREQQVHVAIRDKEKVCSRSFLRALGIAFGIHMAAFFIFQVIPFRVSMDGPLLPPVHVESDLASPTEASEQAVLAHVDRDIVPLRYYLEPKKSFPALPKPPQSRLVRQMEYIKESSIASNPFLGLETSILEPDLDVFEKSPPHSKPFDLFFTGAITAVQLVNDGLEGKVLPLIAKSERYYRTLYTVQVQSQTGQIFWYEPKATTSLETLDKLAEKILLDMKFHKDPEAFVVTGEIEILFNFG